LDVLLDESTPVTSGKSTGRPAKSLSLQEFAILGAGEGIRTLDPNLGKVVLYP
jgi:hypothetical protein